MAAADTATLPLVGAPTTVRYRNMNKKHTMFKMLNNYCAQQIAQSF